MPTTWDQKGAYATVAPNIYGTPERIQGRVRQIVVAFTVMSLPMLIFSGLLLGLIFCYRVEENKFASDDLQFDDHDYSSAYFVRLSATTLITVASWSSTLAPILVGCAITLTSYPVARALLTASERRDAARLPTPFQLSLMVGMISSGSFLALWNWLVYTFGWKGKREAQAGVLKKLTVTLILGLTMRYAYPVPKHGRT